MEKETVTRRDWFRLKKTHENQLLTDKQQPRQQTVLKPIEHPTNHVGMDLKQLPPLCEAELSREQIAQLFRDIEHLASNIVLLQRNSGGRSATGASTRSTEQLRLALELILRGDTPRLQIRYRWQDADWIDTLESKKAASGEPSFRLVRISHASRV